MFIWFLRIRKSKILKNQTLARSTNFVGMDSINSHRESGILNFFFCFSVCVKNKLSTIGKNISGFVVYCPWSAVAFSNLAFLLSRLSRKRICWFRFRLIVAMFNFSFDRRFRCKCIDESTSKYHQTESKCIQRRIGKTSKIPWRKKNRHRARVGRTRSE